MSIEQAVADKLRALPPDSQRAVLAFIDSLAQQTTTRRPLKSPEGLLADLDFDVTEEDIAQARREMWGNFPRPFPE